MSASFPIQVVPLAPEHFDGGKLVADHPGKWRQDSLEGYDCVICGSPCSCTAAEMLIDFRDGETQ